MQEMFYEPTTEAQRADWLNKLDGRRDDNGVPLQPVDLSKLDNWRDVFFDHRHSAATRDPKAAGFVAQSDQFMEMELCCAAM